MFREYFTRMEDRYPDLRPMGYTTFWSHVKETGDNIHFVRVMKNCPICNAMDKRDKLQELLDGGDTPDPNQYFTDDDLEKRGNWDRFTALTEKLEDGDNVSAEDYLLNLEVKRLEKNPNHLQDVRDAYGYYQQLKSMIVNTRALDTAVVVEDFSQYHVGGAFYQSLISCTYTYNSTRRILDSEFRHIFRHNIDKKTNKK